MVIGICGGTGSGKTTITRRLTEALTDAQIAVLQQDHYYKDHPQLSREDRDKLNFDHPDSLDTALLADHIRHLRAGEAIARPSYDFSEHRRAIETVSVEPRVAIIVEGILIFESSLLRDLMDIKVFIDTEADVRFIRRLKRDVNKRGRTVESVIEQYLATVRPMHLEFVEPSKHHADLIISEGGRNEDGFNLALQKIRSLMEAE